MVEDYTLHMGPHRVVGRDGNYRRAAERQFGQYPGLGFTVHDLLTNGDRIALRFSEHGRSARMGSCAVWGGISTYRWDGERLTECWVEQDYYARRRQLDAGISNPVEPPAIDPWSSGPEAAEANCEAAVT